MLSIFREEYERIKPSNPYQFYSQTTICPSLYKMKKAFNTDWNGLLKLIGAEGEIVKYNRRTKEEYIQILNDLAKQLGHSPSMSEFTTMTGITTWPLINLFGSYNKAIKEAGLKVSHHSPVIVTEKEEDLIEMYRTYSNRIGGPASTNDLNNSSDIYNSCVFYKRFSDMVELKTKAGFSTNLKSRNKFTKKQIMQYLKQQYLQYNRVLTIKEINESKKLPSSGTILKYFRTTKMTEVWKEVLESTKEEKIFAN